MTNLKTTRHLLHSMLLVTATLIAACEAGNSHSAAERTALRWADAYFHVDYADAANYVTTESRRWLQLVASNMTEGDLKAMQSAKATVAMRSYEAVNDTLGVATIEAADYLQPDSIGRPGSIQAGGVFYITVVRRDGNWQVIMDGLPRAARGQ